MIVLGLNGSGCRVEPAVEDAICEPHFGPHQPGSQSNAYRVSIDPSLLFWSPSAQATPGGRRRRQAEHSRAQATQPSPSTPIVGGRDFVGAPSAELARCRSFVTLPDRMIVD